MMQLLINPKIKPLYSALLRVNFPEYLISDSFDHLMIELDLDKAWNECEQIIREQSNVAILVPGYIGYAEKALGIFLTRLLDRGGRIFIDVVGGMIADFDQQKKEPVDYNDIQKKLIELGFSDDEVYKIFSKITDLDIEDSNSPEIFTLSIFTKKQPKIDPTLCFVLIPFSVKFDGVYGEIVKIVKKSGFNCQRADEIYSNGPIIEDVLESINKANFLITDLTSRNPNVMYELGIAHQLGKETILLSQNTEDIPFDLRHLRALIYEDSFSGLNKFKDGLSEHISYLINNKKISVAKK